MSTHANKIGAPERRKVMSVIGSGRPLDRETEALCVELGRRAVDAGFRLASGGLGGVMAAVSRGGQRSPRHQEGLIVGVLPGYDASQANDGVDIVVPTGVGIARNVIVVSMADVVVAVDGSSGTLSEIALAWQLGKPIITLADSGGWAGKLAGEVIDSRRRDPILGAKSAEQAVALATEIVERSDGGG